MGARVRARIDAAQVIAIVRTDDPASALAAARAVIAGGIDVVEVSLTTPDAVEVIGELVRTTTACVGGGTVLTVREVDRVALAGASFIVAPNLEETVVRAARSAGLVVGPGVFTAGECARALALGADYLKLFPATIAGIEGFTALRAPFPTARWVPTGGIPVAQAPAWIAAGAAAVGLGGSLTSGEPATVTDRARALRLALGGAAPGGAAPDRSPPDPPGARAKPTEDPT